MERLRAAAAPAARAGALPGRALPDPLVHGRPRPVHGPHHALPAVLLHPRVPARLGRLFAVYFVVLAASWPDFTQALAQTSTRFSSRARDLAVLWLTGIVVIAIHELGHGYTCKYFGGQVHEIGAMLIYFEPAFFCNVNDAWTFPELRARLWVTAAGSWIQMVVASVAAIVWWAAAPGTLVSEVALAAVLIGGITTVLDERESADPARRLLRAERLAGGAQPPPARLRPPGVAGQGQGAPARRPDARRPTSGSSGSS